LGQLTQIWLLFPANAYTSWLTLGLETDDNAVNTIAHLGGIANWTDGMASDGQIQINYHIGGGWMHGFRGHEL
jgi:hypothetical protein